MFSGAAFFVRCSSAFSVLFFRTFFSTFFVHFLVLFFALFFSLLGKSLYKIKLSYNAFKLVVIKNRKHANAVLNHHLCRFRESRE